MPTRSAPQTEIDGVGNFQHEPGAIFNRSRHNRLCGGWFCPGEIDRADSRWRHESPRRRNRRPARSAAPLRNASMTPGISLNSSARGVTKGFGGRTQLTFPAAAIGAGCHRQCAVQKHGVGNAPDVPELKQDAPPAS